MTRATRLPVPIVNTDEAFVKTAGATTAVNTANGLLMVVYGKSPAFQTTIL
jgi:hypothetical protein